MAEKQKVTAEQVKAMLANVTLRKNSGNLKVDDYREALSAAKGRTTIAAALLGVGKSAVSNMIKAHPELQEIKQNFRDFRIDKAESIIDAGLDSEDENTKIRCAMFVLNTEGGRAANINQNVSGAVTTVQAPTADAAMDAFKRMRYGDNDQQADAK